MADETPVADTRPPKPRQALGLLTSHHVSAAHAPKPVRRVVAVTEPPRVVTYHGVDFLVMFDGVDHHTVQDA